MPKNLLFNLLLTFSCLSCSEKNKNTALTIRLGTFPASFSPISPSAISNFENSKLVFEQINKIDSNKRVVPYLVSDFKPTVLNDTLTLFKAKMNPAAKWPNGSPVAYEDIALTLKLSKTSIIRNGSSVFSLGPLLSITKDSLNNNSFSLLVSGNPDYAKMISGDFQVIPEYIFDSLHIWRKYDLDYVSNLTDSTAPEELLSYATAFNTIHAYDTVFFEGSGPYKIMEFVPDQSISLSLRENWWKEVPSNINLPEKINFVVIPDATAARFALQNGEIDLMTQIPPTEFIQLEKFNKAANSHNLYRQAGFKFVFLGFNTRIGKFSDNKTRLALASLLDIPSIISAVKHGYADQTAGPVHPVLTDLYNDSLKLYEQNITLSKNLLIDAGWIFDNDAWTRNGERLEFDLQFNGTNKDYEKIALIIKEEAAKLGVTVDITTEESSNLSRKLKAHQFEAVIWSFIGSPTAFDFSPLYHSEAARPGQLNFTGFGNNRSDIAIEKAVLSQTREEMGKHLKILQQLLHEECPMVFLYFEQSLTATSKKFPRMNVTYYKPGYDPVGVF